MDTGSNRSVCLHQIQNLLSLLRHGIQTSVLNKIPPAHCTGRHPSVSQSVYSHTHYMTHVTVNLCLTSDLPSVCCFDSLRKLVILCLFQVSQLTHELVW